MQNEGSHPVPELATTKNIKSDDIVPEAKNGLRSSLRQSLSARRPTLTTREMTFLQNVIETGDEFEVEAAYVTLNDDKIFFDETSLQYISNNPTKSRRSPLVKSMSSIDHLLNCEVHEDPDGASPPVDNPENVGSALRQEMLKQRRLSSVYGKIWQAHENGFAVAPDGRRQSIKVRSQSFRQIGSPTHRNDEIFGTKSRITTATRRVTNSSITRVSRANFHRACLSNLRSSFLLMDTYQTHFVRSESSFPKVAKETEDCTHISAECAQKCPAAHHLPSTDFIHSKSVTFQLPPILADNTNDDAAGNDVSSIKKEFQRSTSFLSEVSEILFEEHEIETSPRAPLRSGSANSRGTSVTSLGSSMDWLGSVEQATTIEEKKEEDDQCAKPVCFARETPFSVEELDSSFQRPVVMRRASKNMYDGEGIEIADYVEEVASHRFSRKRSEGWDFPSIQCNRSFDETMSFGRICGLFEQSRQMKRSLSEDDIHGLDIDIAACLSTWTESTEGQSFASHDPWLILDDDSDEISVPFSILGTSALDEKAAPHVLSPPLMGTLQKSMPFNKQGDNFWLKFSMIRDGASIYTFLRNSRGSKHTVLAIETVDGEVFGAFLSEAWRKGWSYYGTGQSFLWRMCNKRGLQTHSVFDQAKKESEIEVFHFTGENRFVQLCTDDQIAVGGGSLNAGESSHSLVSEPGTVVNDFDWGAGLVLEDCLLQGSSSPCLTYGSPSLSKFHEDGSAFEIINIELWSLTPCATIHEGEKLELGGLFFEKHARFV